MQYPYATDWSLQRRRLVKSVTNHVALVLKAHSRKILSEIQLEIGILDFCTFHCVNICVYSAFIVLCESWLLVGEWVICKLPRVNPYWITGVLIFGVRNIDRRTREMGSFDRILLWEVHRDIKKKYMNKNSIVDPLIVSVQFPHKFAERSLGRVWNWYSLQLNVSHSSH